MSTLRGYRIDQANEAIIMNFKFNKAASVYGTAEYKMLQKIIADNPNFSKIVQRGRKKTANASKRMTYENIERFLMVQPHSPSLIHEFSNIKHEAAAQASPYSYVRRWFVTKFPEYRKSEIFIKVDEDDINGVYDEDEDEN